MQECNSTQHHQGRQDREMYRLDFLRQGKFGVSEAWI